MPRPGRRPLDVASPPNGGAQRPTWRAPRPARGPGRFHGRRPRGSPAAPPGTRRRRPHPTRSSVVPSTEPAAGPPVLTNAPSRRPYAGAAPRGRRGRLTGEGRPGRRFLRLGDGPVGAEGSDPRRSGPRQRRATRTTRAPSAPSVSAQARPSPLLAAVTTKTRSLQLQVHHGVGLRLVTFGSFLDTGGGPVRVPLPGGTVAGSRLAGRGLALARLPLAEVSPG